MTFDFLSHVQGLSVFENYLKADTVIAAVKQNTTVFTAMNNIIKATPISSTTKAYKILKLAGSAVDVRSLTFCPSERYLAVVGERNIVVVDTSEVKFSDRSSAIVEPFSFEIGAFKNEIKCVLWHPASATKSEIVVLTSAQLFVYDILCSFSTPVLTLQLSNYRELAGKEVCSIAFGSSHNFAGSITLYLSTTCGHIYAIYPFLHDGGHFMASISQLSQLHQETDEALRSLLSAFPPMATNSDDCVAALSKQLSFVESLQNSLAVAMTKELAEAGEVVLVYSGAEFGYQLQSVANVGPTSSLVQISSNDAFSLLAAASHAAGKSTVSYLGQFQPLIMGWDHQEPKLVRPEKPIAAPPKPKPGRYTKPARGFGYVIESESEEEDTGLFEEEMLLYNASLEIFNLRKQLFEHSGKSFGNLTKIAADKFSGNNLIVQATKYQKLLLASGETLYYADLKQATNSLLLSTTATFAPTYKKFPISLNTTTVAYCEDSVNHSGAYAITCSPERRVKVTNIVDNDVKPKPTTTTPVAFSAPTVPHSIPAEELLVGLNKNIAVDRIENFNPESAESLKDVHAATKYVASQISSLTKFVVSLQMKLKFQMDDLNAQVLDFERESRRGSKAGVDERTKEKLARLAERQEELTQKQKRVYQSVQQRFEELRLKVDLPVSDAELEWFKELNVINKTLNYGDGEEKSVSAQVDEMTEQIALLSTDDQSSTVLKMLEMGPELSRVHHFLMSEAAVISRTKAKAQEMAAAAKAT